MSTGEYSASIRSQPLSVGQARMPSPPSRWAAFADGSAELPNWLWTLLGCMGVLVIGFGVLWGIGLASSGSTPAVATEVRAPAPAAAPAAPRPAGTVAEADSPPVPTAHIQVQQLVQADPAMAPTIRLSRAELRHARYRRRLAAAAAAAAARTGGVAPATPEAASPGALAAAVAEKEKPAVAAAPNSNADKDDEAAGGSDEAEAEAPAAPPAPKEKRTAAEMAVLGNPDEEAPAAHEPAPRDVVQAALKALTPRVRRCFFKFQIPGNAQVKLVAAPQGGGAEGVTVSGEFEGTPTGECVAAAVSAAALPPFKGGALRLSHTYVLR